MNTQIEIENKINIDNKLGTAVINSVSVPVSYLGTNYGLSRNLHGAGVKIAILDSGCPRHKDIVVKGDRQSLCENEKSVDDKLGHSTLVSGIIGAKNRNAIVGLAPSAELFFAKVMDQKGYCSFNALVAGILWSIAKEVDIIMISLGSQSEYPILGDAVKKADEEGICVFAAAGNNVKEIGDEVDFPARYSQVYSVGSFARSDKMNRYISEKTDFALKNKMLLTTYLKNKYIRASGSSILTSFVTGIAALVIGRDKGAIPKKQRKKHLYKELTRIL